MVQHNSIQSNSSITKQIAAASNSPPPLQQYLDLAGNVIRQRRSELDLQEDHNVDGEAQETRQDVEIPHVGIVDARMVDDLVELGEQQERQQEDQRQNRVVDQQFPIE